MMVDALVLHCLAKYREKFVPADVKRLTVATSSDSPACSALYIDGKFVTSADSLHFGQLAHRMKGEPCVLDWKYVSAPNGEFPYDEDKLQLVTVF